MGDILEIATQAAIERIENESFSPISAANWAAFAYDIPHERDLVTHRVRERVEGSLHE